MNETTGVKRTLVGGEVYKKHISDLGDLEHGEAKGD